MMIVIIAVIKVTMMTEVMMMVNNEDGDSYSPLIPSVSFTVTLCVKCLLILD